MNPEADASYRMGVASGQRAKRIADVLGPTAAPVYVQSDTWSTAVQHVLDAYEEGFQEGYKGI